MRHRAVALVGLGLLMGTWSCSRAAEPGRTNTSAVAAPASAEEVEATISQLEKDWASAIQKNDAGTLERLIAADFVGTSPTAHTYTKADAINELESGKYVVEKMELDEVSTNVYGDTAVSFSSQEEKSHYAGNDTSGHYHLTDVWVKRNGQWQVVASHGTRYDQVTVNEKGQ